MISLANVVGSAVHLHVFQNLRNKNIGVGVAIAVRVCRQVVGHQVGAHGDVLGDRFTMIAGYSRGKVLWSFYSAGSGFDGITRNGNRGARTAGIGIEKILADEYLLRRVGQ